MANRFQSFLRGSAASLVVFCLFSSNVRELMQQNAIFKQQAFEQPLAAGNEKMQELIYLAGSSALSAEEGNAFCQKKFPKARYFVVDRILSGPPDSNDDDDTAEDSSQSQNSARKIPKVIHMTGTHRCVTRAVLDNINAWKEALPKYSFFFHDREAKQRFLTKHWKDVSDTKMTEGRMVDMLMIRPCMKHAGASLADIWRYMLIFQYGGLYCDLDDSPGPKLNKTIGDLMENSPEALFLGTGHGEISQFFFMAAPNHPLLYFALLQSFTNLLTLHDVGSQYIPKVTGPHAMSDAYRKFMGHHQRPTAATEEGEKPKAEEYFWQGHYVGVVAGNWSVDIVGGWKNYRQYVNVFGIGKQAKNEYYDAIQVSDYERREQNLRRSKNGMSCFEMLYNTIQHQQGNNIVEVLE